MKKFFKNILFGGIIIASLTACGNGNAQEVKNVIKVGVDLKFPPFSYIDNDGNPAGFEIDIAEAFGEFIGKEVEIVNTDFGLLIPALETGDVDILIADMSKTEERAQKVDFSDPYRYSFPLAIVNKDFATEHNITDDMEEKDFFAIEGAKHIGLTGTEAIYYPQSKGVDVTEVTEIGTGLVEVLNGQSHVMMIAAGDAFAFQATNPEDIIIYSGLEIYHSSNFAVRKGDVQMLELSNQFIASMYEDGGLYEQLAPKYDPIIAENFKNPDLGLSFIIYPQK